MCGCGLVGGQIVVRGGISPGVMEKPLAHPSSDSMIDSVVVVTAPVVMEDEDNLVEADRRDQEQLLVGLGDYGVHANLDLEETRVLQVEDGGLSSSLEITRAISTVVGPGVIDRHFGTWGHIELILASIPGARITITSTASPKLKIRDFRKIHTQGALSLSYSSLPNLTKSSKTKFTPKAAQQFLHPPKPYKSSNLPHKPKTPRSSRPTKTISPSHNTPKTPPHSKNTFSFPLPTLEWWR